jgi:PAS domain S-box-containing protein
MESPLHVLHLEDNRRDAELIQGMLEAEGIVCHVTRVETEADFCTSLQHGGFDLIFVDHTLPSFDGLSALKIALERRPEIPFIFVSGTLGEEVAIEALKIGATDYVFKERLSRIVPSVLRALRESKERTDRKLAEDSLRRSEEYLSEAQRLSHTGSFGWDVASGEIYWSQETFRIYGYDQRTQPTIELVQQRTHPEDRALLREVIDRVSRERKDFDFEHRLLMPNGSVKYVRVVGHPTAEDESGNFECVGAVTDITERKRSEEALEKVQAELAHVTRVATLGEMTASIAHEINQPLNAITNSAGACLRWLEAQKPDEVRQSASRVIAESHRASEIIDRIRALAKRAPARKDWLDVNETIHEVIALAHSEVQRKGVALEIQLSDDVPLIFADRIQLQQVILNLMINAVEAMNVAGGGPRELLVSSKREDSQGVLVLVRDSGPGLDPTSLDHLFDAFYTTKPHGLGMGLAICRSIIEAHGGRLWASANHPCGAVFQFTLPIGSETAA